jgi:hypothetical protein
MLARGLGVRFFFRFLICGQFVEHNAKPTGCAYVRRGLHQFELNRGPALGAAREVFTLEQSDFMRQPMLGVENSIDAGLTDFEAGAKSKRLQIPVPLLS